MTAGSLSHKANPYPVGAKSRMRSSRQIIRIKVRAVRGRYVFGVQSSPRASLELCWGAGRETVLLNTSHGYTELSAARCA